MTLLFTAYIDTSKHVLAGLQVEIKTGRQNRGVRNIVRDMICVSLSVSDH